MSLLAVAPVASSRLTRRACRQPSLHVRASASSAPPNSPPRPSASIKTSIHGPLHVRPMSGKAALHAKRCWNVMPLRVAEIEKEEDFEDDDDDADDESEVYFDSLDEGDVLGALSSTKVAMVTEEEVRTSLGWLSYTARTFIRPLAWPRIARRAYAPRGVTLLHRPDTLPSVPGCSPH